MADAASRASRPAGGAFGAPGPRARHMVGGAYASKLTLARPRQATIERSGLDKGSFHIRLGGAASLTWRGPVESCLGSRGGPSERHEPCRASEGRAAPRLALSLRNMPGHPVGVEQPHTPRTLQGHTEDQTQCGTRRSRRFKRPSS